MTPLELKRLAIRMYGRIHWCSQLAINLGVDNATVYRWSKRPDDWQIPHTAEVAIRGLLEQYRVNVIAEKLAREQLRKAGKLRPKLKRKKKYLSPMGKSKHDELPADLDHAADGSGADVPDGDRADAEAPVTDV